MRLNQIKKSQIPTALAFCLSISACAVQPEVITGTDRSATVSSDESDGPAPSTGEENQERPHRLFGGAELYEVFAVAHEYVPNREVAASSTPKPMAIIRLQIVPAEAYHMVLSRSARAARPKRQEGRSSRSSGLFHAKSWQSAASFRC